MLVVIFILDDERTVYGPFKTLKEANDWIISHNNPMFNIHCEVEDLKDPKGGIWNITSVGKTNWNEIGKWE
jgi:predicted transport protein